MATAGLGGFFVWFARFAGSELIPYWPSGVPVRSPATTASVETYRRETVSASTR